MLKLIKSNQKNFLAKLDIILQKRKFKDPRIDLKVKSIIQDIKKNKDSALIKYEKKYSKIRNISLKNINKKKNKNFLDFLTIESNLLSDKSYEIRLIFSGNAVIKIKTEIIDVTLDDQGSPWESKTQPKHDFL